MNRKPLDELKRRLSATASRRTTLRALAAGVAASGVGISGLRDALAKKKKKALGARCKKTDDCKGKLLCKPSNSQNSCYDTTQKRCCKKEGAACDNSCDCCGVDVICNGGFCQSA